MKLKSLLTALLLAVASLASHAVTVALDPLGTPRAGQPFELQLRLDAPFAGLAADEQLLSFGFRLAFDSSLLKFSAFTPAAGWDDDSARLGPSIFSASIFPGLANAGQDHLLLATLRFDVLQAGSTALSLTSDAGDFNQGLGYLFAEPVALAVAQSLTLAPVPEPASLLLMACGLAGVAAWRRWPV